MKQNTLLVAAMMLIACSGDSTETTVNKVDVDDPETVLDPDGDGVAEADVSGSTAALTFELAEPLPEIPFRVDGTEDAAVLDVVSALSLVVSSPRSGVSVSLAEDGSLVAGPPSAPGQWSVELSDDRRSFEVSWYNETTGGLTMKPGQDYSVTYSLGTNCCVATIPSVQMTVQIN